MFAVIGKNPIRITVLIVLTLMIAGLGLWVSAGPASTSTPPTTQQLPWENPDGSLNYSGIPGSMEAVDCGGRTAAVLTDPFERVYRPTDGLGRPCTRLELRYNDDAEGADSADGANGANK